MSLAIAVHVRVSNRLSGSGRFQLNQQGTGVVNGDDAGEGVCLAIVVCDTHFALKGVVWLDDGVVVL